MKKELNNHNIVTISQCLLSSDVLFAVAFVAGYITSLFSDTSDIEVESKFAGSFRKSC